MVGSADIINKAQTAYLCDQGCVVVIPNYRLSPQVTAAEGAFGDTDSAFEWTKSQLPSIMLSEDVTVDTSRIAAMGHSGGGTLALHLASRGKDVLRSAVAFYPSLYVAEPDNSIHKPFNQPPFSLMGDYTPSEEDSKSISPSNWQISEAPLAAPGTPPAPRNRLQFDALKNGKWGSIVSPNGDFVAIDPCTKFESVGSQWPPTAFVSPEEDHLPGSGPDLIERAVKDLKAAGASTVEVINVPGQSHMFDMPPPVGTTDLDIKWEKVKEGLDFLIKHVR